MNAAAANLNDSIPMRVHGNGDIKDISAKSCIDWEWSNWLFPVLFTDAVKYIMAAVE